jgi:chromosome segregation ATPase
VYDIDEITMDDATIDLINAYERIAQLEGDLRSNDAHLRETESQTDVLRGVVSDYEAMQTDLRTRVRNLTDENARLEQENMQLRAVRGASLFCYFSFSACSHIF